MLLKIVDYIMKLLILITFGLAILAFVKPELVVDFIKWIEWLISSLWYWNYWIIFLSGLIEWFPVLWVVVPWQNILMIVWWFFWKISTLNLVYAIVVASFWALISNWIWYILWRYYWESFFKKYWLWFGIWETEVKYLKKWIKKWWATWIILWKFHNLARAFIPFIAWTMKMDKKIFWIYNIIGSILRSISIVVLWVFFAQYYEDIIQYLGYILTWTMIIIWLYIYKYKKKEFMIYMQEKNEEIESKMKK